LLARQKRAALSKQACVVLRRARIKQIVSFIFAGAVFFSLAGCLNPITIDTGIIVDGSKREQSANSIRVILISDTDSAVSITGLQLLKAGVPVANIFPKAEQAGKQYVFENVPVDTGYEIKAAVSKHQDITISGIDMAQNATVRQDIKLTKQWNVSTFAGGQQGYVDDVAGTLAQFNMPFGLVFDKHGSLYAADSNNYRIRKLDAASHVTAVAGDGTSGGYDAVPPSFSGPVARFKTPRGLAYDSKRDVLYVSDYDGHRIRKIYNLGAGYNVVTVAGEGNSGYDDDRNDASAAKFRAPLGLAYDSKHDVLYVADSGNHRIREVIGLTTGTPGVQIFAGGTQGAADGNGEFAEFYTPTGLAYDSARQALYVADSGNHAIRKITKLDGTRTVSTIAGDRGNPGSSDGAGTAAKFNAPSYIALDSSNNFLYVVDSGNYGIRKIDLSADPVTVTTIAGGITAGYGDGAGAAALFGGINGIAVNSAGDVFVTDSGTSFHGVRKLTLNW
jgi:DNA-binding beta-propeller fold protein YncE